MREFVLRARKGPSSPTFELDDLSRHGHLEIVAHCVINTLFHAQSIRPCTALHVVLDGPADPPKTVRFTSEGLGSLGGFDERAICTVLRQALAAGQGLPMEKEIETLSGVFVAKRSFEGLVRQKCSIGPVYYLQPKGEDIRTLALTVPATCVFTDHLHMPKKTDRFMSRLGALPLSVGPKALFASQCIVLVQNELDRQGLD